MSSIAFALRAEYADGYLGGVVAVGTSSLDIKAELEKGSGQIVVPETDHLTLSVLSDYPALERVAAKPPRRAKRDQAADAPAPANADTTEA